MRRIYYSGLAALLVIIMIGCGAQKGKTLFTAGPGSEPAIGTAPEDGTYLLYTAASPNPTITIKLKAGDKLGFQKSSDGRIEAVFKDQTYDFDKATAQVYWKIE